MPNDYTATIKIRCTEDLVQQLTELARAINATSETQTSMSEILRSSIEATLPDLQARHADQLDAYRGLRAQANGS